MDQEEQALIERARHDPLAFGELYEHYVDRIYNYLYQRTGNHFDAEDLTARTFMRALSNLDRYTFRGVPFSAWLYRIAHNAHANWYRHRQRHQMVSLEAFNGHPEDSGALEDLTQGRIEKKALLDAIRQLPSDRQELLILKFSEGLTNAAIAEIMGRTEGAIKSLYHRTLLSLRHELEKRKKD